MATFSFARHKIDEAAQRAQLFDPASGGYASFEGWVRNHNEGLAVRHLEYEAFEPLAIKEGERIVAEAIARFGIEHAACVHRIGDLAIGEMAVWVGVSARHRPKLRRLPLHHRRSQTSSADLEEGALRERRLRLGELRAVCGAWCSSMRRHDHAAHHVHVGALAPPTTPRQMALKEVGASGQAKLQRSRVLVIGCGGLGVPVISYLAGAGIGRLGLVDGDRLEPSNLHRQTMYSLADVGEIEGRAGRGPRARAQPRCRCPCPHARLDALNAPDLIAQHDSSSTAQTTSPPSSLERLLVQPGRPAVFASVYQYEGQLQIVRPGSACLAAYGPKQHAMGSLEIAQRPAYWDRFPVSSAACRHSRR